MEPTGLWGPGEGQEPLFPPGLSGHSSSHPFHVPFHLPPPTTCPIPPSPTPDLQGLRIEDPIFKRSKASPATPLHSVGVGEWGLS